MNDAQVDPHTRVAAFETRLEETRLHDEARARLLEDRRLQALKDAAEAEVAWAMQVAFRAAPAASLDARVGLAGQILARRFLP